MKIGFDLISDLNLSLDSRFSWENKATSLYCVVAGNISSDIRVIGNVLSQLARYYQGVFYTPGKLEFSNTVEYDTRISEIMRVVKKIKNVVLLHHHVVIIDGIAILGCTGWYGDEHSYNYEEIHKKNRFEDLIYLKNSLKRLQKHLDVKKILLVTNGVPNKELYFGEVPEIYDLLPELSLTLEEDLESKVSHWAYGAYGKIVDTKCNGINYVSNPYKTEPYWAKRFDIEI